MHDINSHILFLKYTLDKTNINKSPKKPTDIDVFCLKHEKAPLK